MSGVTVSERRGRHRQHLRQVRLHQPARAAPDGRLRARTWTSCSRGPTPARCWTWAAARGCSCSAGRSGCARARVVGIDLEEESIQAGWAERQAPNLEYRVMRGREPAVRRRRVRAGQRDRGARARARPRAHARRDGPLRRAPPARVGPARAAVADAEHGARRLLVGARQHARAPQPLVQALVRARCSRATARSSRCARRFPGRCCLSASKTAPAPARASDRRALLRQRRAHPVDRDRLARAC